MITVFTPTYNRGYILPILYESLKNQTNKDFMWLIIDDASTDDTLTVVDQWVRTESAFEIQYIKNDKGGGKQRLINQALQITQSKWFFIVDSDDHLADSAIEKISMWCKSIEEDDSFVGVSGVRCKANGDYIKKPDFNGKYYIDCTNLERPMYNLDADMSEVFKTDILRKYPFPVWHDERFTPECVVWDQLALDGYKLRWYDDKIYFCEYLEDGLTKSGYRLYYNNLIGCAMGNNIKLKLEKKIRNKFKLLIEILVCCLLKKDLKYIRECEYPKIAYCLMPLAIFFYYRRKQILKRVL